MIDKDILIKSHKASIGEIRIWNNKKYQKQSDGSWKPVKGQNVQFSPKKDDDYFGRNYFRYAGKPKEAIEFLLKERGGQVRRAYTKEGLGEIDIVYGNDKRGLCHIEKRHLKNQNDFESREDMAQKITDALKYGKVEKDKKDVLIIHNEMRLIISQTLVYDNEDNFRDKHWILTSYNQNIPIKDKIRKAVSEETALEKSRFYPSSETPTFNRNGTERSLTVISSKDFSQPKDTSYSLNEQQFMDEIIEKAKKGSPIGTEKTWGGKVYIKTDKGWKPKGKGTKKINEEDSTSKHSSTETLTKQAASATDEQLKAAIKDPEANSELKKVAQEELNKRNKQQDSDDKSNKQFTVEDAYKNLLEAQEKGELELSQDVLDEIQKKLQESKKKKENKEETVDNKLDKLKTESVRLILNSLNSETDENNRKDKE